MTSRDCIKRLCYRAKRQAGLNRVEIDSDLWGFVSTWIRRFRGSSGERRFEEFERFIFLWVSVNAWASMAVPDQAHNHEDVYLVHSMASDPVFQGHFQALLENERFKEDVEAFAALGPVFQVLWLRNHEIRAWRKDEGELRSEYIKRVFDADPFIPSRDDPSNRYPAFAPACAASHLQRDEPIPADWPHLLHMIYQVRCNLFHGGKTYESAADRVFVDYAFRILWRVWRQIVPAQDAGLMPWDQLFIRSGIRFTEGEDCLVLMETERNIDFIRTVLTEIGWASRLNGNQFQLPFEQADEQEWLAAWEHCRGGAEGGATGLENIELEIMDTHLSGVVRWLNGLGIKTTLSCEGHGRDKPCWIETEAAFEERMAELISRCSRGRLMYKDSMVIKLDPNGRKPEGTPAKADLLSLAERLHEYMVNSQASREKC